MRKIQVILIANDESIQISNAEHLFWVRSAYGFSTSMTLFWLKRLSQCYHSVILATHHTTSLQLCATTIKPQSIPPIKCNTHAFIARTLRSLRDNRTTPCRSCERKMDSHYNPINAQQNCSLWHTVTNFCAVSQVLMDWGRLQIMVICMNMQHRQNMSSDIVNHLM